MIPQKNMNPGEDCCFSLPFDQYQRYKLVSDIIDKFRTGEEKFKILDVGAGFEENLKKFLPSDDIFCLDKEYPPEYSHKEHFIPRDILTMEFEEEYDFVVAVDVYEHISQIDRKKFIDTLIKVSKIATIIAAPFDREDVKRCESCANEIYKNSHGSDYIWLKEHLDNGLPSLPDTLDLIKIHHLDTVIIPNGYLPRWFEMISAYLLTEGKPEFQPVMTTLHELYNQYYYPYDNRNPAYRQALVIPKGERTIDFSDLSAGDAGPAEFINSNQFLSSFIENIKSSPYLVRDSQFAEQKRYIHNLEAGVADREDQIASLKQNASSLENALKERDDQIALHIQYIHNLEAGVADREDQIASLKQNASSLENYLKERDDQIALHIQYIHNLEAGVADREDQIASLKYRVADREDQIASLKYSVADREDQIASLKQNTRNLEAIVADREEHIAEVTPYARHLEQEISAKNRHIFDLTNEYNALKRDNNAIQQSITFQLTEKFHRVFIERLLPQNTRRRRLYDRVLKLGRIFINDGWKESLSVLKKYQAVKTPPSTGTGNGQKTESTETTEKENSLPGISETERDNGLQVFLTRTHSRLVFPYHKKPVVSIIILTYNKSSFTYQCLQSILKYTSIPFELIIVDNGSTDNTTELLNRIDHSILIKSTSNLGFVKGCNEGAKKATGEYVLFLNNDTVVTENWLSCLVRTIETYPRCGAVGGKFVWPNGKLQEAGSIIWNDGSALGYGRGDDPEKPEYSFLREIDFCSAACLLVRTDLFRLLKGFDERYIPAYYEDADLCLGIQNLGYTILFQPDVTIYHHEFTSSSKEHAQKAMMANQAKFVEKWKHVLKNKENPDPSNILKARDSRTTRTILFLDDRVPASCQGSGYPRSNILLTFLGGLGYKVTFFPLADLTPWQPYTHEFQQLGIEVFYGDTMDFQAFARQRSHFYDMVIVSRPHNFEKTFDIIKTCFPEAYLIYDAEALFSTREILKAETEGIPLDDNQVRTLRDGEFALMKKADLIITVSEKERDMIQKTGGIDNSIIFGHPVRVRKTIADFKARKDILFVGSFLAPNGPNDDAIRYFVEKIWPTVLEQLKCKLYIVGVNPPGYIQNLASGSIIVTGFVPNLEEYYNNCRVFIVPHRYAAGIPLKLIEAMSYGIPSVVSGLIASQLNLDDGKEVFIADDPDEFAGKIILLYQDGQVWEGIRNKSVDYIRQTCDPEKLKDDLKAFIDNVHK